MPETDRFCGRCGLARAEDGAPPVDPLIGVVIAGRYRVEHRIGVGGMGTVYLGIHTRIGQKVAIKVLHERYAHDKQLTQRFENEALTYARLAHPNLVTLHDYGRNADGTFFMVLEYCPGDSLSSYLRDNRQLDPVQAVDVVIQIAQGLTVAHEAGVIHRDLKPENVILMKLRGGRFHVKLLDFGIAKSTDEDAPKLTQAGMVFGTPEYMAPEQAKGDKVDERSDVYALGAMLYELICGRPPFTAANKVAVMNKQAYDPPPPPSKYAPDIPTDIEDLILRCLEKSPDARYPSAEALIEGLEGLEELSKLTPIPGPGVGETVNELDETLRAGDIPDVDWEQPSPSVDALGPQEVEIPPKPARSEPPKPATPSKPPEPSAPFGALGPHGSESDFSFNDEEPKDRSGLFEQPLDLSEDMQLLSGRRPGKGRSFGFMGIAAVLVLITSGLLIISQDDKPVQRASTGSVSSKPQDASPNDASPEALAAQAQADKRALEAKAAAAAEAKRRKEARAAKRRKEAEAKRQAAAKAKQAEEAAEAEARAAKQALKDAKALLLTGDFRKARAKAQEAAVLKDIRKEAWRLEEESKRGRKLKRRGQKAYQRHDYPKALASLEEALKIAPKDKQLKEMVATCRQGLPPKEL